MDAALAWVAAQIRSGARVTRVRRLRGASNAEVRALDVTTRDGAHHRLVLRRFVDAEWLAREADLATREAHVLRAIAGCGLPAPELVAVDPDGSESGGVPSVLTTRLRGRIDLAPRDPDRWLRELARVLRSVHAAPVDLAALRPYRRYHESDALAPPAWSRRPDAWARAIEIVEAGAPSDGPTVLVHRDYHPLNALWARGRLTGLVDWVEASRGAPGADVGHCRTNLGILGGLGAADAFAREYGGEPDPYWDLASATDFVDTDGLYTEQWAAAGRPDLTFDRVAARLDELVVHAVARAARR